MKRKVVFFAERVFSIESGAVLVKNKAKSKGIILSSMVCKRFRG